MTTRPTYPLLPEDKWEEIDRRREEYILFKLGNDERAAAFWEWLGEKAKEKKNEET